VGSGHDSSIGGGYSNSAGGERSTIGGGAWNEADANSATISGGWSNAANAEYSTCGGGSDNLAAGYASTVSGGDENVATGLYAMVLGGQSNLAGGDYSFAGGYMAEAYHDGVFVWSDSAGVPIVSSAADQFLVRASGGVVFTATSGALLRLEPDGSSPNLIGGYSENQVKAGVYGAAIAGGGYSLNANWVTDNFGAIGGGAGNRAGNNTGTTGDASYATVAGGAGNTAGSSYAAVGGGENNDASGQYATIGGGEQNILNGESSTVGGGSNNSISAEQATIGGGLHNEALGIRSTVGGGGYNRAEGSNSTIAGGYSNEAVNSYTTISGGYANDAGGSYATVGGGDNNNATGMNATIPGGSNNSAAGNYSFAAGRQAHANSQGCFVWGDSTGAALNCGSVDRWLARASGGFYFFSNAGHTSGVYLASGGNSWNSISDRATKENFMLVDGQSILERLVAMPVQEYNLKSQDPSLRHIGPVAQDFYAAFGYGESDKAINMEDADGVAFAAIQGLYEMVRAEASRMEELERENAALHRQIDDLTARIAVLEGASTDSSIPNLLLERNLLPGAGILLTAVGLAWAFRRGRSGGSVQGGER
jgi:hypothetical protein